MRKLDLAPGMNRRAVPPQTIERRLFGEAAGTKTQWPIVPEDIDSRKCVAIRAEGKRLKEMNKR